VNRRNSFSIQSRQQNHAYPKSSRKSNIFYRRCRNRKYCYRIELNIFRIVEKNSRNNPIRKLGNFRKLFRRSSSVKRRTNPNSNLLTIRLLKDLTRNIKTKLRKFIITMKGDNKKMIKESKRSKLKIGS
jgi:hypothetical protein